MDWLVLQFGEARGGHDDRVTLEPRVINGQVHDAPLLGPTETGNGSRIFSIVYLAPSHQSLCLKISSVRSFKPSSGTQVLCRTFPKVNPALFCLPVDRRKFSFRKFQISECCNIFAHLLGPARPDERGGDARITQDPR